MKSRSVNLFLTAAICFGAAVPGEMSLLPMAANAETVGKSGLPLPRFVSLKARKVNMRVGPGTEYKVEWRYTRSGLPLEILQEYDNWRKVRDADGDEGWISKALLSGKRTAVVTPWNKGENDGLVALYKEPRENGAIVARMEPGVVVQVEECETGWCEVIAGDSKGYAIQTGLWGVYPDERVE